MDLPIRSAKTPWTWRSSGKKQTQPASSSYTQPDEHSPSEADLRHQELLGAFSIKFGRRKSSAGGRTSHSNVSPGTSRPGSFDAAAAGQHEHQHPHHHHRHQSPSARRVSSLAREVPEEET